MEWFDNDNVPVEWFDNDNVPVGGFDDDAGDNLAVGGFDNDAVRGVEFGAAAEPLLPAAPSPQRAVESAAAPAVHSAAR